MLFNVGIWPWVAYEGGRGVSMDRTVRDFWGWDRTVHLFFFLPVYIVAWLVGGSDSTLSAGRGFRQQEKDEAVQQCIIWRAPALVRRDDIQYTRIKQYCFFNSSVLLAPVVSVFACEDVCHGIAHDRVVVWLTHHVYATVQWLRKRSNHRFPKAFVLPCTVHGPCMGGG